MKYKLWNDLPHTGEGEALRAMGIPALCAKVLSARGCADPAEARRSFFETPPLCDPLDMADMDRAAARLGAALGKGERICVYGDYDVDGITATCLLTEFLRSCGGDAIPYIPNRLEEGYGLNVAAMETLAAQGVSLVVTVDCGITAVAEALRCKELGVDMIVTDHHESKDVLPAAVAVVDPHRTDCPYPFKHLAGVGVALKLCMAMAGPDRETELLDRYADLAALGTVADVMSLTGENRTIVRRGLELLSDTGRPGLLALLREAGMADKAVTAMSISYTLAPRINAAGRMGRAEVASELLLTHDGERALVLAHELCQLNRERQEIEAYIFAQCDLLVDALPPDERDALVLASDGWHQGVVGIVASRLTEKYGAPTFMICLQDGMGKGSCRSVGGFNLFTALERCSDLLSGFGGHEMAAGFTIAERNIPAFRIKMGELVRQSRQAGESTASALTVDCVLEDAALLTEGEVDSLSLLEPYGAGNPKPVFRLNGCTVAGISQVGGGKHMKLRLACGSKNLDAIFFSATAAEAGIQAGDRVDVAFTPQINEFRGWRNVQLQVCDLGPARTRAQAENELFRRLMDGGALSSREAAALLPERQEFANLWRYLRNHCRQGALEETAPKLAKNVAKTFGLRETFMRTQVCLAVMADRGLITVEHTTDHLRIEVRESGGKVDLESSALMRQLRRLTGEA